LIPFSFLARSLTATSLNPFLNGPAIITFLSAIVLCLTLTPALAQFVQPLPQPSVYCKDYNINNKTIYTVSIKFDNLDNQNFDLEPGQEVTYHKTKYCSAPAYVVASYSGVADQG
jgi:hypothetical protein